MRAFQVLLTPCLTWAGSRTGASVSSRRILELSKKHAGSLLELFAVIAFYFKQSAWPDPAIGNPPYSMSSNNSLWAAFLSKVKTVSQPAMRAASAMSRSGRWKLLSAAEDTTFFTTGRFSNSRMGRSRRSLSQLENLFLHGQSVSPVPGGAVKNVRRPGQLTADSRRGVCIVSKIGGPQDCISA